MGIILTFLEGIASSFGVGIGTMATFLLSCTIGIILIVNRKFFFSFVLAIGDWIVCQLSKIPLFANGTYLSKIRKHKSAIREIRELQEDIEGRKLELTEKHKANKEKCKQALKRAESCKKNGMISEALAYAKQVLVLEEENKKIWEEDIPNLEAAADSADKKIGRLNEEIMFLKHDRKSTNETRRTSMVLEKANRSLIGDNTESDDMILENYRESVNSRRIRAQGSEIVLSKTPKEKERALDDTILSEEANKLLESL